MVIVIPLRTIFTLRRIGPRIDQARTIMVVLQNETDYGPSWGSEGPDHPAQVIGDRGRPRFDEGMNSVEPQAVEMIALEPVEGIVDREGAHLWNVIIDSMAPRRMGRREERWRVKVEKVTFWAEMIVDDVEKHHQPASVRFVDQRP